MAGGVAVAVALAAVIHNDSVLIFEKATRCSVLGVGAGTASDARAREGETKKDRERGRDTEREREVVSTLGNRLSCHLTPELCYVLFKLGPG